MKERIQKILSARGVASRRKAEEYITRGLVTVNGKVATLGQKADPDVDKIKVDGKVLDERKEMLYYLMNKPVGVVTENIDHSDRMEKTITGGKRPKPQKPQVENVRDVLPFVLRGKVYPVGRLDKESSGLLLMTNDGVLAYRLTHPKFDHDKEYEVTVDRSIPDRILEKLEKGMELDGSMTKPLKTERINDTTFTITLTEGRNRQIRRMVQALRYTVKTLRRVRIMGITDRSLKSGEVRPLTAKERDALLKQVGVES